MDLVRKSFYIDQVQARRLTEYIFQTYLQTGHRLSESEIVREALKRYLDAKHEESGDATQKRG